jgi:aryl-alcohol dehydrogenase-like predicted oxidoreductase
MDMETRPLGRTGHRSSVAVFGAAALGEVLQADAEAALDLALGRGVNHIDVAPSYGSAEERLAPWLERHRGSIFLACKTMERDRKGAWDELQRSLRRMGVSAFDLYQAHAVREMAELDQILAPGGAVEAFLEARERGLVRHIGITGHGYRAPLVHAAAVERFEFETVMTPINFVQWADPTFRAAAERLLTVCAEREIGVLVIKAITRSPWGDRPHRYATWYEPFEEGPAIEQCVRFVLSRPVTAFATPGDLRLLPAALEAAEGFRTLRETEERALLETAGDYSRLFTPA